MQQFKDKTLATKTKQRKEHEERNADTYICVCEESHQKGHKSRYKVIVNKEKNIPAWKQIRKNFHGSILNFGVSQKPPSKYLKNIKVEVYNMRNIKLPVGLYEKIMEKHKYIFY